MAEDKTLAGLIAALAGETPDIADGTRMLGIKHGAAEAVLDEIEATVLGAHLRFTSDAGDMVLRVAGRRLVAVDSVDGQEIDKALLGATLSMDAPEQLSAAGAAIAAFSKAASQLGVVSTHMSNVDVAESVSISALRDAMGIVAEDPNASQVERFLTRAQDNIEAHVVLENGDVTKTEGVPKLVQSLKIVLSTQLSAFLDARAANCPSHSDPSLTLFQDSIEAGKSIGIARIDEDVTIFAFESSKLAEVCSCW